MKSLYYQRARLREQDPGQVRNLTCVCVCMNVSVDVCVCMFACVFIEKVLHASSGLSDCFVTPWTVARQVPLSMGFPRQEYWCGLSFPPPGDLPDPGIESKSLVPPELPCGFFTTAPPGKPHVCVHVCVCMCACMYVCILMCMCMPVFVYMCVHVCMHVCVCFRGGIWHLGRKRKKNEHLDSMNIQQQESNGLQTAAPHDGGTERGLERPQRGV